MRSRRRVRALTLAVLTLAACAGCARGEEAAIRARLAALADEVNRPPAEGLALVAHAQSVGDYFTDDVSVELGPGAMPIQGRATLVGMVARLQSRTAAYRVAVEDVEVNLAEDGATAGVAATVILTPRAPAEHEGHDAREFAVTMAKNDGTWRIARMTAVETLR